ncbi:MAG: hypothetical protein IT348_12775 [Candidatus Eisenbacteria bacterium]|nr:hypothetical protein [Candidatus Eisenbacteria bacterium]
MKRIGYNSLAFLATLALATGLAAVASATTPTPNDVKFQLNNWLTCPGSPVTTVNNYPALVSIEHGFLVCDAWAEQHVWRLSDDGGATVAQFPNNSAFTFGATLTLTGSNANGGECGINIAPWWDGSMSDGRINCRVPDGEIACFGGRMPFYSFTGAEGIHFAMNTPLTLQMTYASNGLSSLSPGTMKYDLVWLGVPYSSGVLNMDEANPAEDPPHGLWGILNYANVGGFLQARMDPASISTDPAHLKAEWTNVVFTGNEVTPATKTSWGQLKTLYR